MKVKETNLQGCFIIEPTIFEDKRGIFFESYHRQRLEKALEQNLNFVQDNHSISTKGVLRGLHFQQGENAQAKLVRVIEGEILDVVVDLRKNSITFGQHFKTKISGSNRKSIFIPKGMAHGFLALSPKTVFSYKCDNYYSKEAERGIFYNDTDLNIDWEYPYDKIVLSDKDRKLPGFKELYP